MKDNLIGLEVLNYVITAFIGAGGMGSVYMAEHKAIRGNRVAIKVIKAEMVNEFTRNLIRQEAEMLAKLNHPNIVRFINYHVDADGNIYLIMELAVGQTLGQYISNVTGLIVEDRIYELFAPILDAVQYAHSKNIAHLDIKPANIIVTEDGTPKVLDFGIARILNSENNGGTGAIMGTPSYMSPEQVQGSEIDNRSDIYSLGVLLHEMLTGKPPYDTHTLSQFDIQQKVVGEPLPRMREFYSHITDKTQAVVDKATAKNPEERYRSCDDFKKDLHRAVVPKPPMPKWVKGVIAAVAVLLVGSGIWAWDYTRLKTSYFRDYTEQWGMPVGIAQISGSDRKHTHRMYRIESSRGKVRRLSHVNSMGSLISDGESERADRPVDAEYFYGTDGQVSKVKIKNAAGEVLYVKDYSENLKTVTFKYDDEHGTEKSLGANTVGYVDAMAIDNLSNKGRISRWLVDYDSNGYLTGIDYAGFQNTRVSDNDRLFGKRFKRDYMGRVIEESYVTLDGTPTATPWGLGIKEFTYDDNGNMTEVRYLTVDRNPAFDYKDGVSIYTLSYDQYANNIEAKHFDGEHNPMFPKRMGFHSIKSEYNDKGFNTRSQVFGITGEPTYCQGGYSAVEFAYDENGYVTEQRYFDTESNPTPCTGNYAIVRITNTPYGSPLVIEYFDVDNKPTTNNKNTFRCVNTYDCVGRQTSKMAYGTDGNLTITNDGTAGTQYTYDNFGRTKSILWLGTDSLPCKGSEGIVYLVFDYDQKGNQTAVTFYDSPETMNRALAARDIAGWRASYDDNGNQTEIEFIDTEGKPSTGGQGAARRVKTYDGLGNCTSMRNYDVNGHLVIEGDEAGYDRKYDERGNCIEYRSIGCDGQLMDNTLVIRSEYDERGNLSSEAFYHGNGTPAVNYEGYHRETHTYDDRNQEIETRYFGSDGKPTPLRGSNFAIKKAEYDERGNLVKLYAYDVNDNPALFDYGAFHSSAHEFDAMGNLTHLLYYGIDGKPTDPANCIPELLVRYDTNGNLIFRASGDGFGNYIHSNENGAAINRMEYDMRNNLIQIAYFDAQDRPIRSTVGEKVHRKTYEYDSHSNRTSEEFFDTDGTPMNGANGYQRMTIKYDEYGRKIEEAHFDKNGSPTNYGSGSHKYVWFYSGDSKTASQIKAYDTAGHHISTYDGYQWVEAGSTSRSGSTSVSVSSAGSFKESLDGLQSELPLNLGADCNYLVILKLERTANSTTFVFKMPDSLYDTSNEDIEYYKEFIQDFREVFINGGADVKVPAGHTVRVRLIDSKGRTVN